jgi:hypothetical protein
MDILAREMRKPCSLADQRASILSLSCARFKTSLNTAFMMFSAKSLILLKRSQRSLYAQFGNIMLCGEGAQSVRFW